MDERTRTRIDELCAMLSRDRIGSVMVDAVASGEVVVLDTIDSRETIERHLFGRSVAHHPTVLLRAEMDRIIERRGGDEEDDRRMQAALTTRLRALASLPFGLARRVDPVPQPKGAKAGKVQAPVELRGGRRWGRVRP